MIEAAFRFCVVGATVAALDFGALWLFKQFLPKLVAVSLAYFIGVTTHFCLNKWWVFSSRRQLHRAELARYIVMVVACWWCTVAVVWVALRFLTADLFVAKVIAVPPAAVLAFLMMRRFVFR
jgi:putative flippase GtrA